jgi:tetratricopeptide (TPR) repeat protein
MNTLLNPGVLCPGVREATPAETHNLRGLARQQQGDLAGARADFEQALRLKPDFPEALNNRGSIRQSQGDLEGALDDFEAALRLNPGYAEARNNRGTARQARGDLAGAIADFDYLLAAHPVAYAAVIHHNRGAARQAAGDLTGALADFDRALQLAPRQAPTWDHRGTLRQALGDLEGARADFDQALRLTPSEAAAGIYHHRGGVRVLQNDFAGAIADYNEALLRNPDDYLVYISRGNARYHRRDLRGFVDYRTAFRLNPEGAAAEVVRVLADGVKQDAGAVLSNCDKHLRLDPRDAIAHLRKGLTLVLLGKAEEAEASLQAAVALVPEFEQFREVVFRAAGR